jgi:hypothetical protein
VIHVGTLHYRDSRWIDVQLAYLGRNTDAEARTYVSLEGVPAASARGFDVALEHDGVAEGRKAAFRIEAKLDRLTRRMVDDAGREDLIVVMHGDTLVLPGWLPAVRGMVDESRFCGIRRDEIGEPIPHWSFCATTAGLWNDLDATWAHGPRHWDFYGYVVTDTGAMLLEDLERNGVPWRPLLRSNAVDVHPLWFGIYGDVVYHHGAGFRTPVSRFDSSSYRHLPVGVRNAIGVGKRVRNTWLSRRMYRRARSDPDFYAALMKPRPG